MGRIAVDVVLLPDETMTDKAIEMNAKLVKQFGSEIVLHKEKCLPHISLAMGCIDEEDITFIEKVLETNPNPPSREERILKQIARELVLMEGSDWPFLLYTKQAKEYANQRFHHHHQRFNKLIWGAKNFNEKNRISLQDLEEIESIDSCFEDINLDYFRKID